MPSLTTLGTAFTENFDSLLDGSELPMGWGFSEAGANANAVYSVGTGSGNAGDTYSFGASGSTDRAFGTLLSGSNAPTIGAQFTNSTGATIGSLQIAYTGEQWRLGATGRTDRLDFQISFDATSLTTGTWMNIDSLDFSSPVTAGTVGALNGNSAANRTAISATYDILQGIPAGATFWIRWVDFNAAGSDDGLAIDDFSITAIGQQANPGTFSVASASASEAQGFVDLLVTRTGGSSGAATVSYTLAGITATAGTDFNATAGTISFADGETQRAIRVAVTNDTLFEGDETFQVTLTGTTAGSIGTATATGTIINDDASPLPPSLSIANASVTEGNGGTTQIRFEVTRTGSGSGEASADYTVNFGNADAADFVSGSAFVGRVTLVDGEWVDVITLDVLGDTVVEPDETFTITLSNANMGTQIGTATATGTIANDDIAPAPIANVFVNELHYDNAGGDVNEAIEVAGVAGTNLAGWRIVLYNGNGGVAYAATGGSANGIALSGIIPDQSNGFGTLSFPAPGIQNGAPDGFALVDNLGRVVQFLSYEGTFTATNGPAAGLTSTDIGVAQDGDAIGTSLQLTGTGSNYEDFVWAPAQTSTNAAANTGQSFLSPNAPGELRILDTSVVEGDAGTRNLVFTVRRAGASGLTTTVDYTINLDGTANAADLGSGAVLSGTLTFAPGVSSQQIVVPIQGDTLAELNETLSVTLANASNATIIDGSATGTITNDDPVDLAIYTIQGLGHRSEYVGQTVITRGIVTAVDANGYYLQDAAGDGDKRTSDAVFVFTGGAPGRSVGDSVEVRGTVAEFLPGNNTTNLTITQINQSAATLVSTGNALPAATLISAGPGGVLPPSAVFEDDNFQVYDPQNDAADFYESLEGMRVTIEAPLVTGNTNEFGETFVVASGGTGATGVNSRGGITISGDANNVDDYNPERIQIDDNANLFAGFRPDYTQGDVLSNVTGIISYNFQTYELQVTEAVTVTTDAGPLTRETTTLFSTPDRLTIATYNVENLDPSDGAVKFNLLASDIVFNLRAPDIIALQEIQDADGAGSGSNLSGTVTANLIIEAINAAGGPQYAYVEVAPSAPNTTGGEPNGNIRNGYLYQVNRVDYVEGSATLVPGAAFNNSRSPLAATFTFNEQTITAINVHSTSRGGSSPLFGAQQPPVNAGEGARIAQSEAIRAYVTNILSNNPGANIAVLGDFNGFYFEESLELLEQGGILSNILRELPEAERYTYYFGGNAQALDNFLVTPGLLENIIVDAVHINSEQAAGPNRVSDHDPLLASFLLPLPNAAPTNLVLGNASVAENSAAGTVVGTLSATDRASDTLLYELVDNAGGRFVVDAVTGVITTTAAFDFEATPSLAITAKVTDQGGLSTEKAFTIGVTDVNEAPVAANDTVSVNEDGTTDNLWSLLLGNDTDHDAGSTLTISAVNDSQTLGTLVFDPVSKSLRYVADDDSFDALAPGEVVTDRFTYTVRDAGGLTSTATVEVRVTGIADGVTRYGSIFSDMLNGTAGEDTLYGLTGNDTLNGLGGHDELWGGIGNDRLFGGEGNDQLSGGLGNDLLDGGTGDDRLSGDGGNDTLTGGAGRDSFSFSFLAGNDTIMDFNTAEDSILLDSGVDIVRTRVRDVNRDGVNDLELTLSFGGSVTLLGVSDFNAVNVSQEKLPFFTETLF
jgi:predicted extracellular nuclease